jgi:8-oxo-dGTP pyrophosphatase MutT (NUDIX family)
VGDVLDRTPHAPLEAPGLRAAVLVVLYDREGAPHLLLTKRTSTLPRHPGQISLPGGRPEPGDADLAATALRETHEEVGLPPAALRLLGRLDDVHTRASDFTVSPFVAAHDGRLRAVPSEDEIARVLEVPVVSLLAADARLPATPDVITLRYPLLGEDVWGATARILRRFAAVVREALDARRARAG